MFVIVNCDLFHGMQLLIKSFHLHFSHFVTPLLIKMQQISYSYYYFMGKIVIKGEISELQHLVFRRSRIVNFWQNKNINLLLFIKG